MTVKNEGKSKRVIMDIPNELNENIVVIANKVGVSRTSIYKLMISLWMQIYWDLENISYLFDNMKDNDNTNI